MEAEIFLFATRPDWLLFPSSHYLVDNESGQDIRLAIHRDLMLILWILGPEPHFFLHFNGVVVH